MACDVRVCVDARLAIFKYIVLMTTPHECARRAVRAAPALVLLRSCCCARAGCDAMPGPTATAELVRVVKEAIDGIDNFADSERLRVAFEAAPEVSPQFGRERLHVFPKRMFTGYCIGGGAELSNWMQTDEGYGLGQQRRSELARAAGLRRGRWSSSGRSPPQPQPHATCARSDSSPARRVQ